MDVKWLSYNQPPIQVAGPTIIYLFIYSLMDVSAGPTAVKVRFTSTRHWWKFNINSGVDRGRLGRVQPNGIGFFGILTTT